VNELLQNIVWNVAVFGAGAFVGPFIFRKLKDMLRKWTG
jgi:high-affinity K+ transport system ATPase subunit B